jgi:tRNA C32,U32 (ribose-2'-O)-methylase TrmJ
MILKGVILVCPKDFSNVGGVARSMAAFGFKDLIIAGKRSSLDLGKAARMSKQGKSLFDTVRIVDSLNDVSGFKVATISEQDNKRYGLPLAELSSFSWPEEFYLVMGREGNGLNFEEMKGCQAYITIATEGKYGVLNLCSATTIILREIYQKKKSAINNQ